MLKKATIQLRGHYARIDANAAALDQVKQCSGLSKSILTKHSLIIPTGLVPRVTRHLEQLGVKVKVPDEAARLQDWSVNKKLYQQPDLGRFEIRFLNWVLDNPCGIIRYRKDNYVPRLIGLIMALFQKANIAIVAKDAESINRMLTRLMEYTPEDLPMVLCDALWDMWPRTLICYPSYIPRLTSNSWHIVVFADFESAYSAHAFRSPITDRRQLLYSFMPSRRKLSPIKKCRLEGLFGDVIFRAAESARDWTPVRVFSVGPFS